MKAIITFFVLLFSVQIVKAECFTGFIFHPKDLLVSKNTHIIIEAFGSLKHHDILRNMDEKFPIFLKNEKRKIRLLKVQTLEGQYALIQVIFKPETPLIVGESYELEVKIFNEEDHEIFHHDLARYIEWEGYEKLEWVVKDGGDFDNPVISTPPKFSETRYIEYGCGPEVFTKFDYQVHDESALFVLTELIDVKSNESWTYYVAASNTQISVGNDMCMGGFMLREGRKYKVRFKFYDINGNTDDQWTEWMKCKNPWKYKKRKT